MAYPLPTNFTVDSGYVELLQWISMITDDFFGLLIIGGVWVIVWLALMYTDRQQNAITAATFVAFILSILLWLMGVLALKWVIILLVGVAITTFFGMKRDYS